MIEFTTVKKLCEQEVQAQANLAAYKQYKTFKMHKRRYDSFMEAAAWVQEDS